MIESTRARPALIQGGMGVAVSGWLVANAVAGVGSMGVVSGTALEVVCARRLQLGDPGGDVRRALASFPDQAIARRVEANYYVPGGKPVDRPFKNVTSFSVEPGRGLVERTVVASFVEVFLAKEGHDGHFVTEQEAPQLVEATFRWVFIQNDGDNGELLGGLLGGLFGGVDKGELRFVWATEEGVIGHREEDKINAGDTVHIGEPNSGSAMVSADDVFPSLGFEAVERDWKGVSFGQWLPAVPSENPTACSDMTSNVVWSFKMTLDQIEGLPECGASALGGSWDDERCLSLTSIDAGDEFAKFQLMISFDIDS